jgi:hypothetical protein
MLCLSNKSAMCFRQGRNIIVIPVFLVYKAFLIGRISADMCDTYSNIMPFLIPRIAK